MFRQFIAASELRLRSLTSFTKTLVLAGFFHRINDE